VKLYSYYRSTASYRVRIALNLKGLRYDQASVRRLRQGDGEFAREYALLNPQLLAPVLIDGPCIIIQSLAIVEYLEETHPEPPLLPKDPAVRAHVRAIAQQIACDIHPLNIMRIKKYLEGEFGCSPAAKSAWMRHWVDAGLEGLEARLAGSPHAGAFCYGNTPTIADLCLGSAGLQFAPVRLSVGAISGDRTD
jgi:maleylpyruvate isomerase